MTTTTHELVLGHLEIAEELVAQLTALVNIAYPLSPAIQPLFQEETVLIGKPRLKERLTGLSLSLWAIRDLIEHEHDGEQEEEEGERHAQKG